MHMSTQTLEEGYWRAYQNFYSWANILQSTGQQSDLISSARHFMYKTAWIKFEPLWDFAIRLKRVSSFTKPLEVVLSGRVGASTTDSPRGYFEHKEVGASDQLT
jgi:hypothetical protein